VVLTDFGCGHYLGAATLTSQPFPPGTPAYRSPEAWRYAFRLGRNLPPPYAPAPSDDVFALGVTAYRLLTEKYPPSTHPEDAESRLWNLEDAGPPSPRDSNLRCCQQLSAVVSRMLSPHPEARGSASELAESLEHAARWAGPEADVPLFVLEEHRPLNVSPTVRRVAPRPSRPGWWPWLAAASLGGPLAFGVGWMLGTWPGHEPAQMRVTEEVEARDGGTVAVGDAALTAPVAPDRAPSVWSTIAVDLPPKPLPGQTRPDATGRCPHRSQIPIHGGCWMKLAVEVKDCDGDSYVYKGGCYAPSYRPARPPTSSPADGTDDP
jgi:serine/threonine-protein kinase